MGILINQKESNNPKEKWVKDMKWHFREQETQSAVELIKIYATSLATQKNENEGHNEIPCYTHLIGREVYIKTRFAMTAQGFIYTMVAISPLSWQLTAFQKNLILFFSLPWAGTGTYIMQT